MSKTPIIDKLKKYLSIIEKITLSKTLDTGYDTSNFTKNWTQAGIDAEKFLGLDKFSQKYGGDASTVEVSPENYRNFETASTIKNINNALFGNARKKQIDLLQVAQTQSVIPESISTPYIWRTSLVTSIVLNEARPIQLSAHDSDFYKIGKSGVVFTRQSKFPDYFYTSATSFKVEQLLYNGNGVSPKPGLGPIRQVQEYAASNYSNLIVKAVDKVKQFTTDEESLLLLEELKKISIDKLPMIIHDSIMLGFMDAANLNIHKTNEGLPTPLGRIGWQVLTPTPTVLSSLENAVMALKKEDEIYLTNEITSDLIKTLKQVELAPSPFDEEFKQAIKDTIMHKKFNVVQATQSTATGIYFVLSQIVNQINKAFVATAPREKEAELFFGNLGYGKPGDRSKEQFNLLTQHAFSGTSAPMAVIRAVSNLGGNTDKVFLIDPYVINMDIKKIKTASEKSLGLGSQKPIGLTSIVHNHIINLAQGPNGIATKKAYIEQFIKVKDKAINIPMAHFGSHYWERVLNTCLNDDLTFKSGILWVGIPPLFWDKAEGGKTIYIYDGERNISSEIEYNYVDVNGNELPEKYKLLKNNSAAIFYDRIIDYNTGKSLIPVPASKEKIQSRQKEILNNYKFKSLYEIREEILKDFYNKPDIAQRDLAQEYRNKILKIFKNTEGGFWSIGGLELASYNPWEYGGELGTQTMAFRFVTDNTNLDAQNVGRKLAKDKYLKDLLALEESRLY